MSDWHFNADEENVIAIALGLAIADGDVYDLRQESMAEELLKEFNGKG